MAEPEDVLAFWFAGEPNQHQPVWFERDDSYDQACARLGDALAAARRGALDHWAETPPGALALILLLDQLSRNLHRGSPAAFAADVQARAQARRAVTRGFDQAVGPVQRIFFYLPFEHSEDLADQDESVRLFTRLHAELGDETLDHARQHRAVIRRFGRFPHRNAPLGRPSTPEELAYLAQAASRAA
jgi:uncharacterized protein (DUF924 family)